MKLKICGIRTANEVRMLEEIGNIDYVGFILAKSKRQVSPSFVGSINTTLKKVGVVVNESIEQLVEIIHTSKIDIIQLHGDEDEAYIKELKSRINIPIWKAIRVKSKEDIVLDNEDIDTYILDSFTKNMYGGSGMSFDHTYLQGLDLSKCMIAGGISDQHIPYLKQLNIKGIDVSSSVEIENHKDKDLIVKLKEKLYE